MASRNPHPPQACHGALITELLTLTLLVTALLDPRPPVTDVERLPHLADLEDYRNLAHGCWRDLDLMVSAWPDVPTREPILDARLEAWLLYRWFDLAYTARLTTDVDYQRECLQDLRNLDPETYFSGRVPPCLPWWRFSRP